MRRIDELFAIEREINGKPAAERLAVREERTKPLARIIHQAGIRMGGIIRDQRVSWTV